MARAHKFVGGGRLGNTMGSVPAETRQPYMPSGRGKTLRASVSHTASLSSLAVTEQGCSSHNDINAFTRTAKSRGPYGGPSFASFNNFEHVSKGNNPSKFDLPSGK